MSRAASTRGTARLVTLLLVALAWLPAMSGCDRTKAPPSPPLPETLIEVPVDVASIITI